MDAEAQNMLLLMNGLSGRGTQEWADSVERAGQADLVRSEKLPRLGNFDQPLDRTPYEQMGIIFHEDIDDLFVRVTLPEGWKKERTDHYMWSKLLDAKGRERAAIFFKPEFYDRSAHISLCRRYGRRPDYSEDHAACTLVITDCGQVVHTIGTTTKNRKADFKGYFAEVEVLEKQADAWLNEHHPDWKNPLAYWD